MIKIILHTILFIFAVFVCLGVYIIIDNTINGWFV
jgi:hypothetical protein